MTSISLNESASKSSLGMVSKSLWGASLEGTWVKLLTVSCLALTSLITILFLWSDRNNWTERGRVYQFVVVNRVSVQIIIQVLVSSFDAIYVYVLCVLVNFSTRLHVVEKPYKLDRLKFWTTICTQRLDWLMPIRFLIPLIVFQILVLILTTLWAGALTSIMTSTTIPLPLKLPQYSPVSNGYWDNLNWTSSMPSKWTGSIFTYSSNYDLQEIIFNDAASAININNLTRVHRKLDNTEYSYAGRSRIASCRNPL